MNKIREFFAKFHKDSQERPRRAFPWINTIRVRGMVVSTGMVLAAVVVAVAALAVSLRLYYYSAMRSALYERAAAASDFFTAYVARTHDEYDDTALAYAGGFADRDTLELQFVNASGALQASSTGLFSGGAVREEDVERALSTGRITVWHGRSRATGEPVMAAAAPLYYGDGSPAGAMRFVTSLQPVRQMIALKCATAAVVGLLILFLVTISNLYFLGTITQPIRSLTSIARRIANGGYGARVEKRYDDEIGELTDTINDMSQKLSKAEHLQTEFISSVSHELRTPLTAITGWSETIAYDEAVQGDSRRGLEIISREAARLTKMVEDLLEFTRIQDGRFTLQMGRVNLVELVEDTLYTYSELFRQAGVEVVYAPPDEDFPEIPGDSERLSQVFLNILDNACKYGREGKRIDVALKMTPTAQAVSVRDHGPGIPPDELPLVKQKFYKGSHKERGNGIGLAVCEEIVARHNGVLTIYNAEGGGLLVTVTLPAGDLAPRS